MVFIFLQKNFILDAVANNTFSVKYIQKFFRHSSYIKTFDNFTTVKNKLQVFFDSILKKGDKIVSILF